MQASQRGHAVLFRRVGVPVAVLCVVFAVLGVLVRYSVLQWLDVDASHEVQEVTGWPWIVTMRIATFAGSSLFLCGLAVVIAVVLFACRHGRTSLAVALSLLALPADAALKQVWERARPDAGLVHVLVSRSGYSFPSGHSMGSTAVYGTLAVLTYMHLRSGATRALAVLLLVLLVLFVDLSRIYLGAHWLSDVLGGTTAGLIVVLVLTAWYVRNVDDSSDVAIADRHSDEAA